MQSTNMNQYILQSADNSLLLIELLCSHEELSLADMVSIMDYGGNSIFRILNTLEKYKMVTKTENNRYRLSYRLAAIGSIVTDRMKITGIAHPYLVGLSIRTKEATHLAVLMDDAKVQFSGKVRGDSSIQMGSSVSMAKKAHLARTRKARLTFCDEAQIESYIKDTEFSQMTRYTIKDERELREGLDRTGQQGHVCDKEESEEGLVCFATPAVNFKGKVVAAVSISGFRDKMYARQDEFIREVRETVRQISAKLA